MSEREAEPADIRPFLPRPGEPVEEYAERLRAMHRDLSVVLQAVERGLARGGEPERAPAEPVHAVHAAPADGVPAAATAARAGMPRVEVMPSRSRIGHRAGDEAVQTPWADAAEPDVEPEPFVDRRQPPSAYDTRQPSSRPDDPRWAHAVPPEPPPHALPPEPPHHAAPPPLAERPSLDPRRAPVEPPRIEEFTPPTFPPAPAAAPPAAQLGAARRVLLPSWAIAAILAGWLTIVALLLALLIEA